MNINDFLLTTGISLTIGLLVGYFIRDLIESGKRFYQRNLKRSRYFEQDMTTKK